MNALAMEYTLFSKKEKKGYSGRLSLHASNLCRRVTTIHERWEGKSKKPEEKKH